ncbi:hypothetical protein LSAT2_010539 [Lamellibrachia satsuma]|nr:hypothetical protein LSAT2_010539 [Lamellibrachia satsuma]
MLTRVTLRPVAGDVAVPPTGPHLAADLFLRASAYFGVLQEFFISRIHLGHKVAYVRHTSVNGSHPNVDLTYTRSVVFIRHTHVREHARAVVERRVYVRTSANVSPTLSETSIAGPTVSTAFYDIGDVGAVISHQLRKRTPVFTRIMSSQAKHEESKANGSDARQTTADARDPETGLPPTGDDRGEAQRCGIGARVLAFLAPSDPVTGVDGGWAWMCLLTSPVLRVNFLTNSLCPLISQSGAPHLLAFSRNLTTAGRGSK